MSGTERKRPSDRSLSARRAWIEIELNPITVTVKQGSLSARRAWIEIEISAPDLDEVDGRSPQGERGLKSVVSAQTVTVRGRSPQGERGLKSSPQSISQNVMKSRSPQGERGLKSATDAGR